MKLHDRPPFEIFRRILLPLSMLMYFSLAGCGGNDSAESPSNFRTTDSNTDAGGEEETVAADGAGNTTAPPAGDASTPATNDGPPRISGIYPSGNIVPANLLKLHIEFSQPMRRDGLFEHLRLIDLATGDAVPQPFQNNVQWSKDSRRLTLQLRSPSDDPSGESATPLQPDGNYELEISGEWQSSSGAKLGKQVAKPLRVGPADRLQPDSDTWILSNPPAGTDSFLSCDFHEPLDWLLLQSELSVQDAGGKPVLGRVEMGYGELSWTFYPEEPWKPGKYRLKVGTQLSDLAGNSLEGLHQPGAGGSDPKPSGKAISLDFEVFGDRETPP